MRIFNLDFSFSKQKKVLLYKYDKYQIRIELLESILYKQAYFYLVKHGYNYGIYVLTITSSLEEDINNKIDKILIEYLEFSKRLNVKLHKQMTDLIAFI